MKQEVFTGRRSSKPISAAIQTESMIFVSGQGGLKPGTTEPVGPDVESQTVQTIGYIRNILESAGAKLDDIVKTNVYLKRREDYESFNEVYAQFFQTPYPSRTTVYCDLNYDLLVEIDAIAVRRQP